MKERVLSLALCGLLLLTGCQNETVQEEIWELEAEDAAVFADGEAADRWRGYQNGLREPWVLYELSDGTVLLQENDTGGPEGSAAYAALSEDVQAAVSAWYQGEGARYDLTALLQACYDRYQAVGSEAFTPGLVAQTAAATALSEKAVYLVTTVEQAVDPAAGEMLRYGTAFDRATGQRLEVWSLFTKPEAEARLALAAALISIVSKEAMYWYTRSAAKKVESSALMADAWHHRSDALSSIGSFAGILGARLGLPVLDPIASVVICIFILKAAVDIFRDAISKMVDRACSDELEEEMRGAVLAQEGVLGIDRLQTRLFGDRIYVELDIAADGNSSLAEAHQVSDRVHDTVEQQFPKVKHCMVHVNPYGGEAGSSR